MCCLGLLQSSHSPDEIVDTTVRAWLEATKANADEWGRLKVLATDVIRKFIKEELKDAKAVSEAVYLAPILEKDVFREMLKEFSKGIEQSPLLDLHQLEGLAQMIQGADPDYPFSSDDLVKMLRLLNTRLVDTHHQATDYKYHLISALSHVLDAMADSKVSGLSRVNIHEPLTAYLESSKSSTDPFVVYQAAYAYQALLCVPDDESPWQAAIRRTGKVIRGVSGLVSAVKGLDFNEFISSLTELQQGLEVSKIFQVVRIAYDGVSSIKEGQGFLEYLKEGFSFKRKCAWYTALRGADTFLRNGQLAEFRRLVCEASCRRDPAFQWGVCHRLGEIAVNPLWNPKTRQSAIAFLGEIYRNDAAWGKQPNVKQWILDILMQLSSLQGPEGEGM